MKLKFVILLSWGIAIFMGYVVTLFRLPNLDELKSIQTTDLRSIEERIRKKNGTVVGRTLHMYFDDDTHVVHPNHFGSYAAIRKAIRLDDPVSFRIWRERDEEHYGIYQATVGGEEILSFENATNLRRRNIAWTKGIGIAFFLAPGFVFLENVVRTKRANK